MYYLASINPTTWLPRRSHPQNYYNHHFDAVTVNSQELERVDSVKLLGGTITNKLQWTCHVLDVIQKAKRI